MKKLGALLLVGAAGLILWWKRHDLIPPQSVDQGPAPRFRTSAPPATTAESAPVTSDRDTERPGPASDDDLQRVKGIGPVYAGRLADEGITTFAGLINADSNAIADALDVVAEAVDDWKQQAADLA